MLAVDELEPELLASTGSRMVLPSNGKVNSLPTYGGSDSETEPNNMQVRTSQIRSPISRARASVNDSRKLRKQKAEIDMARLAWTRSVKDVVNFHTLKTQMFRVFLYSFKPPRRRPAAAPPPRQAVGAFRPRCRTNPSGPAWPRY
jgi:hypothetical protein